MVFQNNPRSHELSTAYAGKRLARNFAGLRRRLTDSSMGWKREIPPDAKASNYIVPSNRVNEKCMGQKSAHNYPNGSI